VVRGEERYLFSRLLGGRDRTRDAVQTRERVRRAEEKWRAAVETTQQWLTLLREMETTGESDHARYDTYFGAYLQARDQEKRIELELFNLRQGLAE
jgi:hypothetical protein